MNESRVNQKSRLKQEKPSPPFSHRASSTLPRTKEREATEPEPPIYSLSLSYGFHSSPFGRAVELLSRKVERFHSLAAFPDSTSTLRPFPWTWFNCKQRWRQSCKWKKEMELLCQPVQEMELWNQYNGWMESQSHLYGEWRVQEKDLISWWTVTWSQERAANDSLRSLYDIYALSYFLHSGTCPTW